MEHPHRNTWFIDGFWRLMPYQSFSRASPGESHWKAIGSRLAEVVPRHRRRIAPHPLGRSQGHRWSAQQNHPWWKPGRLGRSPSAGWMAWFVPQPGGVAKHHFHWEKMGNIWNIVLSEVALRLVVCFEYSCMPELLYVIWVNKYSIHMTVKQTLYQIYFINPQ